MEIFSMEPTAEAAIMFLVGCLIVGISAGVRFSHPSYDVIDFTDGSNRFVEGLKKIFLARKSVEKARFVPPRAHTTVFRYRLYQGAYVMLAVFIYWAISSIEAVRDQFKAIIVGLGAHDVPLLDESGVIVLAVFVVFILPNIPPFVWADSTLRRLLYERAQIPAQQLREMHRLKLARYQPDRQLIDEVRDLAVNEGLAAEYFEYTPDQYTTQSLWAKCMLVIKQIKLWQAEDRYKHAFAVLKDASGERLAVEKHRDLYNSLIPSARYYFKAKNGAAGLGAEELEGLEADFRMHCKLLLEECYKLLSRVSLHSHFTDKERVRCFKRLGFELKEDRAGPIPDLNDLLALIIILGIFIVLPLSQPAGLLKAGMIGGILLTAILTPVFILRYFPNLGSERAARRYTPNLVFPVMSGLVAALAGAGILTLFGSYLPADNYCQFTGLARYANCSYPWSYLHFSLALLLAWRMRSGSYPKVSELSGINRILVWGDPKDALICGVVMVLITYFTIIPSLGREFSSEGVIAVLLRVLSVSLVIGFVVPTWYRANALERRFERRRDLKERERFINEMGAIRLRSQMNTGQISS